MFKKMKTLASVASILILAACQTTGTKYTSDTVPLKPQRSDLSEKEYAVKLTAHLFPRKCITYKYFSTTGYDKDGPKNKVTAFNMTRVEKNSLDNGWYNSQINSAFARGKIYININSDQIVCGRKNWLKRADKDDIRGIWDHVKVDIAQLLSTPTHQNTNGEAPDTSVKDRLNKIKQLLDEGLIDSDEAAAKRKAILDGV